MFTLPNFCRVCLKYDKNLIDLEHIENEPNETLMCKLVQCVAEVEWSVFKPLLCHPCIKRLNLAYTFKKQCIQSAAMLKSYVSLVQDAKTKVSQDPGADLSNAYMMLPNQKYIKIVMGAQNQNSLQNVFVNVVPTPAGGATSPTSPTPSEDNKDTNQNVFTNINNTFQKFINNQDSNNDQQKSDVSNLLTDSNTEELSVEIDPTDLGFDGDSSDEEDQTSENSGNDWEDLITTSQIKTNGTKHEANVKGNMYGNFVPILPKQNVDDFQSSGQHFLSSQLFLNDFSCETCQRQFTSSRLLKQHNKQFHSVKPPYKCDYCYAEYVLKFDYEQCLKRHKLADPLNVSLTLNDFKAASNPPDLIVSTDTTQPTPQELQDLNCELCKRQFNSTAGLLRHKVRKHNQKAKKKYFIKGMKNAKCDICNREFSTQSYMQLHRKLHMRDDIGYKYKVFGKDRYSKSPSVVKTYNKRKSVNHQANFVFVDNPGGHSRNQHRMAEDYNADVQMKEENDYDGQDDDYTS